MLRGPHGNIGHLIRNSIFLLSWNFSLSGMNFKESQTEKAGSRGVCVVYDVMGESGSQVVPQPPMLSYTQFLRVCLYMTTPDLSLWHMSEIAPLHL